MIRRRRASPSAALPPPPPPLRRPPRRNPTGCGQGRQARALTLSGARGFESCARAAVLRVAVRRTSQAAPSERPRCALPPSSPRPL
eukprot:430699-Prymnesium_polylepis.1